MSELSEISVNLFLPELIMLSGLVACILIPNLGDARMRIPLTNFRFPTLLGGTRFEVTSCLLYTSPSPRDRTRSRMPSSA